MGLLDSYSISFDHFIGGERVASERSFDDISPIDGSVIAQVSAGGRHEAYLAITAAEKGFEIWSRTKRSERAAIMRTIATLIEERVEVLAMVETIDNGSLLRSHLRSVMPRVAHNFRFFAQFLEEGLDYPDFETRGHKNHVSYDPSGPSLLISPWNAPLMLETWKIAPALAAGNSVVLKPSEWSPLTASILADITKDAGLPDGVFNVVQGIGEEVGPHLVGDHRIARISFTGSVPTAKAIASLAAKNLTPCSFELGGKSPFIVFGDADLDLAVKLAIDQFDNAGQVCLSGTRLLIEDDIFDQFIDRFTIAQSQLRQGDPRADLADIGPQIHPEHLDRIDRFVQRAKANGSKLIFGGERNLDLGGLYYRPTLFVEDRIDTEIFQEEIFGPVLVAKAFSGVQEAIAIANSTKFGLAGVVVTSSREVAERVSSEVVAGTIWNNCFFVRDLSAPFGGSKSSGVGREGGHWSFDFFCDVKNSVFAPTGWAS
ncbi:MAG: aldehyde dehydrogenase [Actinomycetota bacterium]|nr:aldehyde dehydrogenase [Actinomycetota bacterium]